MSQFHQESFGEVTLRAFGPLVMIRLDAGWATSDLTDAMGRLLEIMPARFATITEMRKVKPAGAIERKSISERLSTVEGEVNRRIVVSAVVTDSMLARGAVRAVRWLNPARYPVLTFEYLGSAVDECLSRLRQDGAEVSAEDAREAKIFAARVERDRQGRRELG